MAYKNGQLAQANQEIEKLREELRVRDKTIKSLEDNFQTERKRAFQALTIAEHSATAIAAMSTTISRLNRSLDEIACKMVQMA